jgi:uncharacterized protein (TIGR02996 family)
MIAALPAAVPPLPAPYLRAVLAHPDDDGPRLVAADWWDEQGAAERAEFVRVQVTLAANPGLEHCTEASADWCPVCGDCRCPGPEESKCDEACPLHRPDSPHGEYEALRRRERELRTYDNVISWLPVVEPWGTFLSATCASHLGPGDAHCCNGPSPVAKAEFRRGFVEELTAAAADFLAHADALTAACPLRRVRLTGWADVIEACHVGGEQAMRIKGRPGTTPFYDGPLPSLEEHRRGARFPAREPADIARSLFTAEFPGIDFELPLADITGFLAPLYGPGTEFASEPPWRVAPLEGTSG